MRIGVNPVHDWTSHYVDAVRYGATVLLSFNPRDAGLADIAQGKYEPTQWGYVFEELDRADEDEGWLGADGRRRTDFIAPTIRVRS